MLRNRSLLNMNEEDFFESDHSYRAKSLMCVSDYEDFQKEAIPPSLTPSHTPLHSPSITPIHTPSHNPSITPVHSPSPSHSITPDHISLSEEALSTENEEIAPSIQVEPPDQSNEPNLVDAIFASCTPTVPSNNESSKTTIKPTPKPKPRQTRSRSQPVQSKSKKKPKTKQTKKPDSETKEDTKKSPCRDFENGVCSRGDACKYYHDPAKGKI